MIPAKVIELCKYILRLLRSIELKISLNNIVIQYCNHKMQGVVPRVGHVGHSRQLMRCEADSFPIGQALTWGGNILIYC